MNHEPQSCVVGAHVGHPTFSLLSQKFTPPSNFVGCLLLGRMLELALIADGLSKEDCCVAYGAELNDCIFLSEVTDPDAACNTIKRELQRVSLLLYCQIGEANADGWRCVYPSPEIHMTWLMDSERLEAKIMEYHESQARRSDVLLEAVRQLGRNTSHSGDKK